MYHKIIRINNENNKLYNDILCYKAVSQYPWFNYIYLNTFDNNNENRCIFENDQSKKILYIIATWETWYVY